ncbi:MAG: 3-deoxy-manno-octulosonate cytidylyltransferase [Chitinophagales bacterium]|nr:3-deoxy-manno-octulosonate cytidylyltransferase [Chitinophagales bacterium]
MEVIGVIPARMSSTRFPGKPLVDIGGKSMVRRVYEQAQKSKLLDAVYVATDNKEIADEVESFGGLVQMTADSHQNGTSRCAELVSNLSTQPKIVVNIQGDEPFFNPSDLNTLIACFKQKDVQIASLAKHIELVNEVKSVNVVKVVFDANKKALYFSRAPIPFHKEASSSLYYKHIGLYAYRTGVLNEIVKLPSSPLERIENLEQLRWLENGYNIHLGFTNHDSNSVDTPEDLAGIIKQYNL